MHSYYIDDNGRKDGPHDLVTIMRRIRAGKIIGDTLIYEMEAETPVPASSLHDIALFFEHDASHSANAARTLRFKDILANGWTFTMEHNVMTAYAGGLLLVSVLTLLLFVSVMDTIPAFILAWCVFMVLHNFYFAFVLRMYRRQPLGQEFLQHQLGTSLMTLIGASIILALMSAGGLLLFIVPGVLVLTLYIFVPFLLVDYKYQLIEAMHASRLLLHKHNRAHLAYVLAIVSLHLMCAALLIPLPLTLPIFSASLAAIYEELSIS